MAKYENITEIEPDYQGNGIRIGLVMSRFNIDVCEGLLSACVATLQKQGVKEDDMLLVTVPGALEIPLTLTKLAKSGKFDALIALGAVIRGDTYHFEIVSNESARGVTEVMLATGVPVANGILTTDTDDQALFRMGVKGADAAMVAIEMVNLARRLS